MISLNRKNGGIKMNAHEYFSETKKILDFAKENQKEALIKMSRAIGDVMMTNGLIQLLGVGADRAFAMELGYRAGGLMPYHQVNMKDLVLRGLVSLEEYQDPNFLNRKDIGKMLWSQYNIDPKDALLIYVASTATQSVFEITKLAKAEARTIFFVGSIKSVSRNKLGKDLIKLADYKLDLCTPYPDTLLTLHDTIKITQVANVVGNIFAQMMTAETYLYLKELGQEPPVLLSANVTGADVHNRKISDVYLGRWNS
jgi:uncharacterized phosphosugar-binding protein